MLYACAQFKCNYYVCGKILRKDANSDLSIEDEQVLAINCKQDFSVADPTMGQIEKNEFVVLTIL